MLRVLSVILVLALMANARAADRLWEFTDLRTELSTAETLPEQREAIERMREAVRTGTRPGRQIGTMIYSLKQKPVLNEPATISFLQELIAIPGTAESATNAITGHFRDNAFSDHAGKVLAKELHEYHRLQGLSDAAIRNLQGALTPYTQQVNREYALDILLLKPPSSNNRDKFLSAVSELLTPEVSVGEKQAAIQILVEAAKSGPLPGRARGATYKAATAEQDAAVRVAAWPLVMQARFDRRDTDRGRHYFFGARLNEQLIAPVDGSTPSFLNADNAVREQAVALLNGYWHPEYHAEYIDILIELVGRHGSPASMEKLLELRGTNALSEDQLAALTTITANDLTIKESLETITIPNLEPDSLMGPAEVIANSNDQDEWALATQQLLAQYPDGPVPVSVADSAYAVMTHSGEYDAAAVSLFARGEIPFAEREAKALKLLDRMPQHSGHIVRALQHLHGDVGIDFLVRRYANDTSIEETFRGTLLNTLYRDVRESGQMDSETTKAVAEFARSADGYFSISVASRLLEASGANVPWSIRIREQDFRWGVLIWVGLASLAVGAVASLFLLVLVALPGRSTGLSGAQRISGFVLWLIISVLLVGAAGLSVLHSIGHNSTPPVDRAFPYYAATLGLAIALLVVAISVHRKRSSVAHDRGTTAGYIRGE